MSKVKGTCNLCDLQYLGPRHPAYIAAKARMKRMRCTCYDRATSHHRKVVDNKKRSFDQAQRLVEKLESELDEAQEHVYTVEKELEDARFDLDLRDKALEVAREEVKRLKPAAPKKK